ncbi:MAG: hypothetical protein GY861_07005 [bacterium]|nr:hypothetical protein [bacterium]
MKILKAEKLTPDTMFYQLDARLKSIPGQFVEVSATNIGEAPFAIADYSEKNVELVVRGVGNVTKAMANLKTGDQMGLRGPFGNGFPVDLMKRKSLIIISGGTGIAAVRGLIQYAEKNEALFDGVYLFFGFRSPKDIVFKDDIDNWRKKFKVELTVDKGDDNWKGNVGLVTALLEQSGLDEQNAVAVSCGPPIMIKFVVETLQKLGFEEDQIYVSLERMMQCGIGKCGHCLVGNKYVCKDGPVFSYKIAKELKD